MYVIDAHTIWAPRAGSTECAGLALPPGDLAGFASFSDAVVTSERIVALLDRGAE